MAIGDSPYFSMLKNRMQFLNERQKVLADNVANVSTPKFTPRDLDEKDFQQRMNSNYLQTGKFSSGGASSGTNFSSGTMPVTMIATQPMHIQGAQQIGSNGRLMNSPDSETTLDGNSVVVEEQMIKVADTRMNYDIALSLYQKGLQLMRMAAKKPGSS